jgi:hypothetical protein
MNAPAAPHEDVPNLVGLTSLSGNVPLPGVTHCDVVGERGAFVSIYGWTGAHNGGTRQALRMLKEFGSHLVVHDPGEAGTSSRAYWDKMLAEGLVDTMFDHEDVLIAGKALPWEEAATLALPAWFTAGAPVPDVFARSVDAEFILDGDFERDEQVAPALLDWRECLVPIEAFGFKHESLEAHIASLRRVDAVYEASRLEVIRAWVSSCGGIEAALAQSPALATMTDGVLKLEDGFHRLGIAKFEHGAQFVRTLCASMPKRPALDLQATEQATEVARPAPVAPRITTETVDSLAFPMLVIGHWHHSDVSKLIMELDVSPLALPLSSGSDLARNLLPRDKLQALAEQLSLPGDVDLVELYALTVLVKSGSAARTAVPRRELLDSASARVGEILLAHPEYLHPHLHVADGGADRVGCLLLLRIMSSPLCLTENTLAALRADPIGRAGLTASMKAESERIVDFALTDGVARAKSVTNLLRAGHPVKALKRLTPIAKLCAQAVTGSQEHLDDTIELLEQIARSQKASRQAGIAWNFGGEDLVEQTDFAWASAASAHPVLTFIHEAVAMSAAKVVNKALNTADPMSDKQALPASKVIDLPDAMARIVARLNAILVPSARLPMSMLAGPSLVKLITVCPRGDNQQRESLARFWQFHATKPLDNTPRDFLRWALEAHNADGTLMTAEDLDDLNAPDGRILNVLGDTVFGETRAGLVQRSMQTVISTTLARGATLPAQMTLGLDDDSAAATSLAPTTSPRRRRLGV